MTGGAAAVRGTVDTPDMLAAALLAVDALDSALTVNEQIEADDALRTPPRCRTEEVEKEPNSGSPEEAPAWH